MMYVDEDIGATVMSPMNGDEGPRSDIGSVVMGTYHGEAGNIAGADFVRSISGMGCEPCNDAANEAQVQEFEQLASISGFHPDHDDDIGSFQDWANQKRQTRSSGSFWDWAQDIAQGGVDIYRMRQERKLLEAGGNPNLGRPWWLRQDFEKFERGGGNNEYGGGSGNPKPAGKWWNNINNALGVAALGVVAVVVMRK